MKKFYPLALFLLFAGFIYNESVQYPHGIVGLTRLNGDGCVCHTLEFSNGVNVRITGPDSLVQGTTAEYTVIMTGGNAHSGGFNAAARTGLLTVSDTSARKIDTELTHTGPKVFTADTVKWRFLYTAPASPMTDTLYAVGLSADGNGFPSSGDLWNFSPNKPVRIIAVIPVELSSFSVTSENNIPVLRWITASETNNSGFAVERSSDNQQTWETLSIIHGAGTTTEPRSYIFKDELPNGASLQYRLKQTDYNGAFRYYGPVGINLANTPAQYLVASNFPNPFNPATTISYTLPSSGALSVKIYNAAGALVHQEALRAAGAESGQIVWDAANNASGIYYIHLNFAGSSGVTLSKTIKSILLR